MFPCAISMSFELYAILISILKAMNMDKKRRQNSIKTRVCPFFFCSPFITDSIVLFFRILGTKFMLLKFEL